MLPTNRGTWFEAAKIFNCSIVRNAFTSARPPIVNRQCPTVFIFTLAGILGDLFSRCLQMMSYKISKTDSFFIASFVTTTWRLPVPYSLLFLLSRSDQRNRLRSIVGAVVHVQCRAARANRRRGELYADGAMRFRCQARAAGVCLAEIAGVSAGQRDARDGQRCGQVVGQRHMLGGARRA